MTASRRPGSIRIRPYDSVNELEVSMPKLREEASNWHIFLEPVIYGRCRGGVQVPHGWEPDLDALADAMASYNSKG